MNLELARKQNLYIMALYMCAYKETQPKSDAKKSHYILNMNNALNNNWL